jgi:hypothetical protein
MWAETLTLVMKNNFLWRFSSTVVSWILSKEKHVSPIERRLLGK